MNFTVTVEIVTQPLSVVEVDGCGTLTVSCTATGGLLDSFVFAHNGQALTQEHPNVNINITVETIDGQEFTIAHLTICSVTHENSGNYTCTAQDCVSSDEANFTVNVLSSPGTHNCI